MKKVLSFTLASLALAALCAPAYAGHFGGSIRGDVGPTGSQVPYYGISNNIGVLPVVNQDIITFYSDRKDAQWDFTGRLFFYTSCAPCPTYIAGSWQGSNHTVNSSVPHVESLASQSVIPVRAAFPVVEQLLEFVLPFPGTVGTIIPGLPGSPVVAAVSVKNEFSKAKLGFGMDFIKTCCFSFTMEVGASYLDAKLNTDKAYGITQTVAQGPASLPVVPGVTLPIPLLADLPLEYVVSVEEREKTEGVGMYAMFKGEYKFPASCLGNCFSIYGKAEVGDIIGRQNYSYNYHSGAGLDLNLLDLVTVALFPVEFSYQEHPEQRYSNIVEVDLEAALVYSPCFKCWDNLNMSFALGVRTDSFVNLFAHPQGTAGQSIMSLTRPTVFLEIGVKV